MTKSEIISQLLTQKLVVVIRGNTEEEAYKASKACIAGGITTIEIAYSNNKASQVIEHLTNDYINSKNVIVGAGTVLDAVTARMAILAGAKFIVSPAFSAETAKICNLYAIPYLPGCMTLTEITTALEYSCELVKLFPGGTIGQDFISSIKAPLPQVKVMVTGGVNSGNAKEWFQAGASAIGIGGEFNKLAARGEFEKISTLANEYCTKLD
ncbi:bifunctional 2-keto-4-hydroxyglutarate aldolase/2-keto-3-deoxy-6-phosphogluconate aldolase [Streptococcus pseudoporcinus]|uniref:4-hydroxy-2-oxoglutarate aldolase @ 2-dehydro-3-deoxyphosphogluconate aldolase n=1 Tax=Streptococcus pseudoporcinus TaxID=361101 RepID=A0A4U9XHW0_9STRE|nr:bifunctional 2-keto-4-hydroxyglutarate aldolase/2-keto-3-deoxy-6-phosphogluconate aldolase [Streptococcus pseudoporcinus]VTS12690.1 4-hydroxy-2-oxoglutarate aldolase @ 2-dehydro-3-deoxyphosphogluconate aldolase [Streptococcus pseudoporcinus]VUC65381.1 4-hydroxy-2-oxoglutarate aldolase @ 2-dehydro-3-deoxyphosphogluconate aldolase [Streptococcus pseudoporcinus]VUC96256.1 4-hydroxy-2-oxoglutarate aldolase @ 2-dehydro-3-deoxyphosphogluconate aldolase [Streptococcus pseudoporcinus]VUC96651.1 4-hy